MNKKVIAVLLALCLVAAVIAWVGVGPYTSGSAVADLRAELEAIYGPEYIGKDVENGTEDMVFSVESGTWFLTNWNLRNAFGMDYEYKCQVTFTTHGPEGSETTRTVTYLGIDPMGGENEALRAYLDPDSKTEK